MNFELTQEQLQLQQVAREFAETKLLNFQSTYSESSVRQVLTAFLTQKNSAVQAEATWTTFWQLKKFPR